MPLVTSGVDHGNLRELALRRMEELDLQCRDGIIIFLSHYYFSYFLKLLFSLFNFFFLISSYT